MHYPQIKEFSLSKLSDFNITHLVDGYVHWTYFPTSKESSRPVEDSYKSGKVIFVCQKCISLCLPIQLVVSKRTTQKHLGGPSYLAWAGISIAFRKQCTGFLCYYSLYIDFPRHMGMEIFDCVLWCWILYWLQAFMFDNKHDAIM